MILIFSVKESGAFQGFARINGPSQKDGPRIAWVLPPGISAKALSGVFKLDWVSRSVCYVTVSYLVLLIIYVQTDTNLSILCSITINLEGLIMSCLTCKILNFTMKLAK